MSVDIERHHDLLPYLNVETGETVSAKHVKHHFLWIRLMRFNNKTLRLPLTTGRNTCPLRKGCDNSSL